MLRRRTPIEDGTQRRNNGSETAQAIPPETNPILEQELLQLVALGHDAAALQLAATKLLRENFAMREAIEEVRARQEQVRQELATLTQPEQHSVVITGVERNGSVTAEVYGAGGRLRVAVHDKVDPQQVRVGARGLLAKGRNCLLHIDSDEPECHDVGTFECYLDGKRRAILKHQEQSVRVTLADSLAKVELRHGDLIAFDREGSGLAYSRIERPGREHLFAEDVPDDSFSQLGGLQRQIAQIQRAINFGLLYPEVSARYGLASKRGILLSGPPGNGKTRIARCTANYIRQLMPGATCRFMSIVGSSDYSVWLGGSEARLKERFEAAREAAKDGPCVLYFDEIDAIGRHRGSDYGSGAPDRILNTFLGLLDGVHTLSGVIVMASTNRPDTLDPGLTRPGRFDVKIHIPSPNREAARSILQCYLANRLPLAAEYVAAGVAPLIERQLSRLYSLTGDYAELATVKLNDGRQIPIPGKELVSGAMLENMVRRAAEDAAQREVETGAEGLTEEDLALSLDRELRSAAQLLSPANVKAYVSCVPRDAVPIDVKVSTRSTAGTYTRRI